MQKRLLLGTEVSIKVFPSGVSSARISMAISKAFEEIKRIEDMCSVFNKSSEISRLNSKAAFAPVKISEELFSLIEQGLRMSEISKGAFDVTATSLNMKNGYKSVVLNKEKKEVSFNEEKCRLDLGAYAKGYAVDRAVEILRKNSVKNAVVDAGGDVRVMGLPARPAGGQWKIGIRNPLNTKEIFKVIELNKEAAVVSSGNYLREHIVSLRDRDDSVLSVTVIAPNATEADLFSTALFNAAGEDERLEMVKGVDDIEVLVIKQDKYGELDLVKEIINSIKE